MVGVLDVLTVVTDGVLATEITFEDDPMAGVFGGLAGLSVSAYAVRKGRKWRGSTKRQRDRYRKSHVEYVPRIPELDFAVGVALGAFSALILVASCAFLVARQV